MKNFKNRQKSNKKMHILHTILLQIISKNLVWLFFLSTLTLFVCNFQFLLLVLVLTKDYQFCPNRLEGVKLQQGSPIYPRPCLCAEGVEVRCTVGIRLTGCLLRGDITPPHPCTTSTHDGETHPLGVCMHSHQIFL